MTILQLNAIKKEFADEILFENIDLRVEKGAKIGFVGVNGSGKTTLFKIIAGVTEQTTGNVTFPNGTTIGYLEQHPLIDSDESIMDTLLHVFDDLIELENKLRLQEEKITVIPTASPEYEKEMSLYGDMLDKFDDRGGYRYKSDIKGVLKGLGFEVEEFDKEVSECSGGQRTRIAIARILLEKPDIMLLDEPTNHLDLKVVRWLENHLNNYDGTVLVISHDRYFLDNVCDGIAEMENGGLLYFDGNYSEYYEKKVKLNEMIEKQYNLQQREIKRLQGIIDTFKSYNREKSIKQARSREKQLNKIKLVTSPFRNETIRMAFEIDRESGNDVIFADDISKTFGTRTLFENFSMHVIKGDRIAIIGDNGCGKSTLLKIIKGIVQPDTGEIRFGSRVSVGYYDQSIGTLNQSKTILDEIYDDFPELEITYIRKIAGVFLFKGDDVFKTIDSLSGGEKARVMLIKLMLNHDNLLLLDEPTNHLDMASKEILEAALDDYEGTLIAVSHDRYFINRFAEHVYAMENGVITKYIGNYDDYIEKITDQEEEDEESQGLTKTALQKIAKKEKENQNKIKEQKNKIKELEKQIDELESKKQQLEARLADEEVYSNSDLARSVNTEYESTVKLLEEISEEWLLLTSE
ncbi:MAG: ABC-F family ATP-binding cassette domain-containing protein [Clostridiales bacterium]|nr:ABC-F family ATP-binding cassette domain-containing protein [Clostridiales bacterium]